MQLRQLRKYEKEIVANERIGLLRCSCCGEPIKLKSPLRYKACLSVAAPSSPRAAWFSTGNGDGGSVDAYTELKLIADSRSELHGDGYGEFVIRDYVCVCSLLNRLILVMDAGKEGMTNMFGDEPKTPHFSDRNRFFGVALSDGAPPASPRRLDFVMEPLIKEGESEADLVACLKRQVTLDRRSMMALYMELDEERSASAVAANNAMAMITRLQEEKAAVQMEALQYKRMMEEQAEYDQEAMKRMKSMLVKREEEITVMGYELEEHGERYSVVGAEGSVDLSEVVDSCAKVSNDTHQDDIVNLREREVVHDEDHQDDIVNSSDDAREVVHNEDHQDDIAKESDDAREVVQDEDHQDDIVNSRSEEDSDAQCEATSHDENHQDIVDSQGEGSDAPCQEGRDEENHQEIVNLPVVSPRAEEERKIQDELAALNYEGEMCHILCQLAELEERLYSADDAELEVLAKEVRLVKGRLRAVEAESVLLKHVAMSVQKRGVLSEIAQHLRKLRQ